MLISKEKIYSLAMAMYLLFKFELFNQDFSNFLALIILILLAIILMIQKYSLIELLSLVISLSIFGISAVRSGDVNFLIIVAFIFASKETNIKRTVMLILKIYLVYFSYMLFRNFIGLETTNYSAKYINGVLFFVKNYGFGHPNQLSIRVSIAILMFVYCKMNKMKLTYYCIIIGLGIVIYNLTLSKTGLAMLVIPLLITILFSKKERLQRFICITMLPLSGLIAASSIYLPMIYDNSISHLYIINNLLTGRLRLANHFFVKYPITPFGQKLDFSGVDNVLDSMYPFILLQYGFITFFLIVILTTLLLRKMIYNKMYYEAILFQFFLIIGVSELTPINLSFNFTLLFFSLLFLNDVGTHKEKLLVDNKII